MLNPGFDFRCRFSTEKIDFCYTSSFNQHTIGALVGMVSPIPRQDPFFLKKYILKFSGRNASIKMCFHLLKTSSSSIVVVRPVFVISEITLFLFGTTPRMGKSEKVMGKGDAFRRLFRVGSAASTRFFIISFASVYLPPFICLPV